MSSIPQRQASSSTRWLSNILRPRASSVSIESCLNVQNADPTLSLDARIILPLIARSQPLRVRCRHLRAFSELCRSYRFAQLDNVFFAVQDILIDPYSPPIARNTVFEFMIACIQGQYGEFGMARVMFYSTLRNYENWDDFADMYRVLVALCKGGRDISDFEKNIGKLLTTWLDKALVLRRRSSPEEEEEEGKKNFVSDILHLLTDICKFNFAMFEEKEVMDMIQAVKKAMLSSSSTSDVRDIKACLGFADIVVRYRFVPFGALRDFMDMLCIATVLPDEIIPDKSSWTIFTNLLRSHCAHNAILTLCKSIGSPVTKEKDTNYQESTSTQVAIGAISLLTETAWGSIAAKANLADLYQVPDSVIITHFKRGAQHGNDIMRIRILESLMKMLEQKKDSSVALLEWETVWDICDICTLRLLTNLNEQDKERLLQFPVSSSVREEGTTSGDSKSNNSLADLLVRFLDHVYRKQTSKTYTGPIDRFMGVLYRLRYHISSDATHMLLNYYEAEHLLLPSSDGWIECLLDIVETFFIPSSLAPSVRLHVLSIVTNVCNAVKDFYLDDISERIVCRMMAGAARETHPEIRQKSIDLVVLALSDCRNQDTVDKLLDILRQCASCRCLGDMLDSEHHEGEETADARRAAIRRSQTDPPTHGEKYRTVQNAQSQSTTTSPNRTSPTVPYESSQARDSTHCTGVAAMCGLVELFEEQLKSTDAMTCLKLFKTITSIGFNTDDLVCPFGGPKIAVLDILLRLRCLENHHIYIAPDPVDNTNTLLKSIREMQERRKNEKLEEEKHNAAVSGIAFTPPGRRSIYVSPVVLSYSESEDEGSKCLPIGDILEVYLAALSHSSNWDLLYFLLQRLPLQLGNKHLFCGASATIEKLRRRIVTWISNRKFLENVRNLPPNIRRNDLNVHAFNILMVLVAYRRIFSKQNQDEIVYAFYMGLTQVTAATKLCIHALTVCCHELPLSVAKMLNEILQRMSQIISVSSVSVHILEFLSGLARLPNLYANFTSDMYKPVFAIALNYLQHSQTSSSAESQRMPSLTAASSPSSTGSPIPSSGSLQQSQQQQQQQQRDVNLQHGSGNQGALSQYVLIMAYLVITIWFTSLPLRERRKHVSFIIQRLLSASSLGKGIDEQTFTCIDMLSRLTFADISLSPKKSRASKTPVGEQPAAAAGGSSSPPSSGDHTGQRQSIRTWVYGHTLLTIKTVAELGRVEVIIRRPSGTMSMMCNIENGIESDSIDYRTLPALLMKQYRHEMTDFVQQVLSDFSPGESLSIAQSVSIQLRKTEKVFDPVFLYLQLSNYPELTRLVEMSPLPDDEATARSIAILDRIPVVDFHKIGVLYVGKGQKTEVDILANTHGSPAYINFLNSLGTIEPLKGRKDNTGGLDREMDIDGKYAYFWRDDVTEVIFHVATLMPTNLERDPQCSGKKRHIGNDFVTIVYNDSGEDYAFDTLPGQFNFINIVISPHSISNEKTYYYYYPGVGVMSSDSSTSNKPAGLENTFFKVEMQRRPDMPEIGPISEPKLVSGQSLPAFVRQTALHANIFAQVFLDSGAGGRHEYVSHWRERLRQIKRIRERVMSRSSTATTDQGSSSPNVATTAATTTASASAAAATAAAAAAAAATGPTGNNGRPSLAAVAAAATRESGVPVELLLDFTKYS